MTSIEICVESSFSSQRHRDLIRQSIDEDLFERRRERLLHQVRDWPPQHLAVVNPEAEPTTFRQLNREHIKMAIEQDLFLHRCRKLLKEVQSWQAPRLATEEQDESSPSESGKESRACSTQCLEQLDNMPISIFTHAHQLQHLNDKAKRKLDGVDKYQTKRRRLNRASRRPSKRQRSVRRA